MLLICLLGLAAAGCQASDPGPPPFSYGLSAYPVRPGTRYVTQFRQFQGTRVVQSWIEEVRLESVRGDLLEYAQSVHRPGAAVHSRFFVLVRQDALYFEPGPLPPPTDPAAPGQHSLDGAARFFRFPLEPHRYWEFNYPAATLCSREVVGMERVTVPAGTFNAVKIKEVRGNGSGYSWFAPGLGVVKSDLNGPSRFVKELVQFARGK